MSIEVLLNEFKEIAANPAKQLNDCKAAGKKAIGVLPYFAAGGLLSFGRVGF